MVHDIQYCDEVKPIQLYSYNLHMHVAGYSKINCFYTHNYMNHNCSVYTVPYVCAFISFIYNIPTLNQFAFALFTLWLLKANLITDYKIYIV